MQVVRCHISLDESPDLSIVKACAYRIMQEDSQNDRRKAREQAWLPLCARRSMGS